MMFVDIFFHTPYSVSLSARGVGSGGKLFMLIVDSIKDLNGVV